MACLLLRLLLLLLHLLPPLCLPLALLAIRLCLSNLQAGV